MDPAPVDIGHIAGLGKQFSQRLLTIGENRLELLMVEMQEERDRLLHAILLALGVALFALLAMISLTAAITVLLWPYSPTLVLATLTCIYSVAAVIFYRKLSYFLGDWKSLSATFDQLRKDCASLRKQFE